jgi:hypothetical protein
LAFSAGKFKGWSRKNHSLQQRCHQHRQRQLHRLWQSRPRSSC